MRTTGSAASEDRHDDIMERIVHPQTYVQGLERQLRGALGVLVLIAIVEILIMVFGPAMIESYVRETDYPVLFVVCVSILALIAGGGYLVQRAVIPEGMHIWIDEKLFGSLDKSNSVIFAELIRALTPAEQEGASQLHHDQKMVLTEAVFSELANDPYLFVGLVRSRLFVFWNGYWILIYSSVIFPMTTLATFIGLFARNHPFVTEMFIFNGGLSLLCITAAMALGAFLQRKSRSTVDLLLIDRRDYIAQLIRRQASVPRNSSS